MTWRGKEKGIWCIRKWTKLLNFTPVTQIVLKTFVNAEDVSYQNERFIVGRPQRLVAGHFLINNVQVCLKRRDHIYHVGRNTTTQ